VITGRGGHNNLRKFLPLYLFLFAFLIRLAFLLGTYQGNQSIPYFEDVGIAINLLDGIGYAYHFSMIVPDIPTRPTAAKPPVYPLLVSLVFLAFGMKNFFALFIVHAFLSALTCSLLFLAIARFSLPVAAIAGVALAIYLPFIHHAVSVPESTTLTLFLISLFSFQLMGLHAIFKQSKWILAGVVSGLLALTEPVTIPFLFLSFFYISYVTFSRWGKISKELLIAMVIFTAVITPWTIRNYITFKRFVFIKSNFGAFLKDGLHHAGIRLPQADRLALRQQVEGMDEVSEDRAVKKAMLSWMAENPMRFIRLLPKNFLQFWWETEAYKNNYTIKYIVGRKIPYMLLLIFSVPAMLWRLIQTGQNTKLSLYLNVYHNMMFILIFTYTIVYTLIGAFLLRYHFPVELGMFVFFAEAVLYVSTKILAPGHLAKASSA
jgi:4-amino-4-deoxy-L-arabinose transferase-like glycosyltransferase